jgi:hypothetical protein
MCQVTLQYLRYVSEMFSAYVLISNLMILQHNIHVVNQILPEMFRKLSYFQRK